MNMRHRQSLNFNDTHSNYSIGEHSLTGGASIGEIKVSIFIELFLLLLHF